jgi:hypothetical protein
MAAAGCTNMPTAFHTNKQQIFTEYGLCVKIKQLTKKPSIGAENLEKVSYVAAKIPRLHFISLNSLGSRLQTLCTSGSHWNTLSLTLRATSISAYKDALSDLLNLR